MDPAQNLKFDLTQKFGELLKQLSPAEKAAGAQSLNEEIERYNFESEKAFREEKILTAKHQNKALENKNKLFEENTRLRKKYARSIFILTCCWASLILIILILSGANDYTCFYLSEKIIITLITSTTVNIFTFFVLVVRYLFPAPKPKTKPKA